MFEVAISSGLEWPAVLLFACIGGFAGFPRTNVDGSVGFASGMEVHVREFFEHLDGIESRIVSAARSEAHIASRFLVRCREAPRRAPSGWPQSSRGAPRRGLADGRRARGLRAQGWRPVVVRSDEEQWRLDGLIRPDGRPVT
jgi:hypothetical protein